MSKFSLHPHDRHGLPVLPGTGRLGIVRAYFDITAVLGASMSSGVLMATLWPGDGPVTGPAHPWFWIVAGAAFTWGAVQTSRALGRRQRSGALAAGVTFVAGLAATGLQTGTLIGVGMSVVGLALLASVWRYLE